jgi:protein subunit release factor B
MPTSADYESMLNDQQHQMSMQVSEKEIEIDRLKTTVVSLNSKCVIVDDHITDVQNNRENFQESEVARVKLQEHIVISSQKIITDNSSHTDYQQELINEIASLKKQLEDER